MQSPPLNPHFLSRRSIGPSSNTNCWISKLLQSSVATSSNYLALFYAHFFTLCNLPILINTCLISGVFFHKCQAFRSEPMLLRRGIYLEKNHTFYSRDWGTCGLVCLWNDLRGHPYFNTRVFVLKICRECLGSSRDAAQMFWCHVRFSNHLTLENSTFCAALNKISLKVLSADKSPLFLLNILFRTLILFSPNIFNKCFIFYSLVIQG